ncbi:MAG: sulfur carrier protein ThiS [Acidobacteriota bacterium]
MSTVEIVINGEGRTVPEGLTVLGLLESLGLDPGRVAVELDREIVRPPAWAGLVLEPGARLEIVHFVGGG